MQNGLTDYASNDELRSAFIALAHWVWRSMGDAHRLKVAFNEETVTESILLSLARDFSHRGLSITSFNKHQEGKSSREYGEPTGADWEFWFTDLTGRWLGVRVQAKRLYLGSGRYEALHGNGSQIATLVNNCGPAIPIYVLYNGPSTHSHFPVRPSIEHRNCRYCGWPYRLEQLWGCAIAMPEAIPQISMPRPSEVCPMLPWHVIWCQNFGYDIADRDIPTTFALGLGLQRLYNQTRRLGPSEPNRFDARRSIAFEPTTRPPFWVLQLDEGQIPEGLPEGVDGIAIIRDTRNWERG